MKWLMLVLLVACTGEKGSGSKSSGPVVEAPESPPAPTPPRARPRPQQPVPARSCVPGGLPREHVRAEDYLAFPNFGYRGVGRCRGHAILSQKLLLLLRFDPSQSTLWNCDTDPVACRQDIRAVLNAVEENQVVVVPGFSSLAEFSAHPVVQAILRARIISYGSRYSASRLPLPGDESRSVLVFKEALRRVKLHQIPYLALNGLEVGNHGVLAYAESEKDGQRVLCVRDPNIVPAQGREECDNYFYQDGENVRYVRYARPEDVVNVELTDDEDRRTTEYRRTLCK